MVVPEKGSTYNQSLPPDSLWLKFPKPGITPANKTYAYTFRGEIVDVEDNEIDLKVSTFNNIGMLPGISINPTKIGKYFQP